MPRREFKIIIDPNDYIENIRKMQEFVNNDAMNSHINAYKTILNRVQHLSRMREKMGDIKGPLDGMIEKAALHYQDEYDPIVSEAENTDWKERYKELLSHYKSRGYPKNSKVENAFKNMEKEMNRMAKLLSEFKKSWKGQGDSVSKEAFKNMAKEMDKMVKNLHGTSSKEKIENAINDCKDKLIYIIEKEVRNLQF